MNTNNDPAATAYKAEERLKPLFAMPFTTNFGLSFADSIKALLYVFVTLHLILLASLAMRGMYAGGLPYLVLHVGTIILLASSVAKMRIDARRESQVLKTEADALRGQLRETKELLEAARQDLLLVNELQQEVSRHDNETGTLTTEAFFEEVGREIDASRRTEVPHCMFIIQADPSNFAQYGAAGGATEFELGAQKLEVLKSLARVLGDRIRTSDRMAAISPDQLAILLYNTSIEEAAPVCEGLVGWIHKELDLSVSAGLSELQLNRDNTASLLNRAKQALEHALVSGGDRLSVVGGGGTHLQRVQPTN